MKWLRTLWDAIRFLFKPTFYVFASVKDALDALPRRGGTLLLGAGTHSAPQGIAIPEKPVRIIGVDAEKSIIELVAEGNVVTARLDQAGELILRNLRIQGVPASPPLLAYLSLEEAVGHIEGIDNTVANGVRDQMDLLWVVLTNVDRTYLDGRPSGD